MTGLCRLLLVVTLWNTALVDTIRSIHQVGSGVGTMVSQVVEQHLASCHLVLITTTQHSPVFTQILRQLALGSRAGIVVEASSLVSLEHPGRDQPSGPDPLLQRLWGDAKPTCHAVILDLTNATSVHHTLRFLETCGLWKRPETSVVAVGGRADVEVVLLHHSLRNALHAIYLALADLQLLRPRSRWAFRPSSPRQGNDGETAVTLDLVYPTAAASEGVRVYQRCAYCDDGMPAIEMVYEWSFSSSLPRNSTLLQKPHWNMMGHRLTAVILPYFPFMEAERDSDQPGTTLMPRDSVTIRMIDTFAAQLNYTYELREPLDGKWGIPQANGNWTGIVGALQHQQGDFTVCVWMTEERTHVMDHSRVYSQDPLTIVSLGSYRFNQYLSLIKPFTRMVWLLLLLTLVVWVAALWLLLRAWSRELSRRGLTLTTALFYGWAVLLENPPAYSPTKTSGRVMVSSWLVFCLVITTAFRSSLYAHLTSQTSPAINTLEDLVKTDGWEWGSEKMRGAAYLFFFENSNPIMQIIASKLQESGLDEQMARVQRGGYSFITYKYYIRPLINPTSDFYISNRGFDPYGGVTWAFRKGAPFRPIFDKLQQRLIEGGFINLWLDEVIRKGKDDDERETARKYRFDYGKNGGEEVLSLNQMQGAFYALLMGHGLAFLTLLGERLAYRRPNVRETFSLVIGPKVKCPRR